jgi:hypothetical protein
MEYCNLCKPDNYKILEQYNVYVSNININYYFYINNKFYQCVCYNKCSQFNLYKDKNKWLNYIGLLCSNNSIINIIYKNKLFNCIRVEFIPKDTYFIKNIQINNNDNESIVIEKDDILKQFNTQSKKTIDTQTDFDLKSILVLELNQKNNTKNIQTLNLRLEKLENEFEQSNNEDFYKV